MFNKIKNRIVSRKVGEVYKKAAPDSIRLAEYDANPDKVCMVLKTNKYEDE